MTPLPGSRAVSCGVRRLGGALRLGDLSPSQGASSALNLRHRDPFRQLDGDKSPAQSGDKSPHSKGEWRREFCAHCFPSWTRLTSKAIGAIPLNISSKKCRTPVSDKTKCRQKRTSRPNATRDGGPGMTVACPNTASTEPARVESIEDLFFTLESPLLSYALGLVGERALAEDTVQEAFMKLHAQFAEVREPRRWLYRTVHNLALNHRRDSAKIIPLQPQRGESEG